MKVTMNPDQTALVLTAHRDEPLTEESREDFNQHLLNHLRNAAAARQLILDPTNPKVVEDGLRFEVTWPFRRDEDPQPAPVKPVFISGDQARVSGAVVIRPEMVLTEDGKTPKDSK